MRRIDTTTEEYSGSRALRMMLFWGRALDIYSGYKIAQARIWALSRFISDPQRRESQVRLTRTATPCRVSHSRFLHASSKTCVRHGSSE
jgi:hypothetical protein